MPTSGIYLITNTRNNLVYVGKTKNLQKRKREHFSQCFRYETVIDAAIAMEPENFTWQIIKECPVEDLDYYEQYYIFYLDAMNHGYNMTPGGDCPVQVVMGERHPATYYTDEEILEIRKEYVTHSIEELYKIYKKDQSFYTFKNQVLNSYKNLPKYNKKNKEWIYPPNWDKERFEISRTGINSNLLEDEIMEVRRLSMTKTNDEIIAIRGLGNFKSPRHLREVINGKLYKWLPFYSRNDQHWIYPENWQGKKEEELDESNWMDYFYQKEKKNGRKLSNYQVLQIRYLATLKYNATEISKKLNLENVCSNDAIRLVINNKSYLQLPYLSFDKQSWVFPDNLSQIQKDNFPKFVEIIKEELQIL